MKQKINLRLIEITILAIVTTTICITFVYYSFFENQVKRDLKTSGKILRETSYFETKDVDADDIELAHDFHELRITWIDSDGKVLYDNDVESEELSNHGDRPEIKSAIKNGSGESVRKSDTMNMNTYYYAMKLDNGTILRVSVEAVNLSSVFVKVMPAVCAVIVIVLIICVFLSHVLTKQLIAPIERMAQNIEEQGEKPPYRELIPFVNIIKKQHTDIISAAKMRQDFSANISHELKTPLTAISGYAELIENGMVDEKQQIRFVGEIRKNAERLISLINDIINLSELDRCEKGKDFEETDLFDEVSLVAQELTIQAGKRGINIFVEGQSTKLLANREMIKELIENLMQNAIRYNNEGGYVKVSTYGDDGHSYLVVEDNGIGIPKDEHERIFERFYRVDKSRSKATGGTGLGLAIVKHIVELHEAKIEVESEPKVGTKITIIF